jgi:hypothetical protein
MMHERVDSVDQRIAAAVVELQGLIRQQYPEATFDVVQGEDPDGCYIWASVDTDDPDAALDSVVDRLLTLQVDERISVHVIPIRSRERGRATLEDATTV